MASASGRPTPVEPAPILAAGPGRQVAVDVARGLAVLLMIQTHAFDGWVAAEHKASVGYGLTRVVASIPAPLFLMLAGVGLSLGAQAAAQRGKRDSAIRWALARRGLGIVGYGYLASAVYAAIEGRQPWASLHSQLFRADILHCIGLSLALCSLLILRRTFPVARAVGLMLGALLAALALPRLVALPSSPWLAALWGLWLDVPGYTRFPLLPLVGFCALGVLVGGRLPNLRLSPRAALASMVLCALVALLAWLATRGLLGLLGGRLSRSHPAVVANFIDGAARSLATLALAHWLAPRLSVGWLGVLLRLGSASLFAYALHIPLCYGRLAAPLFGRCSVAEAAPWVLLLMALCWGAVRLRDALYDALRPRKTPA